MLTFGQVGQAKPSPSPTPTQSQAPLGHSTSCSSVLTLLHCAAVGLEESSRAWIFRSPRTTNHSKAGKELNHPHFRYPRLRWGTVRITIGQESSYPSLDPFVTGYSGFCSWVQRSRPSCLLCLHMCVLSSERMRPDPHSEGTSGLPASARNRLIYVI